MTWADQPYKLLPVPGQPGEPTSTNQAVLDLAIEMTHVHNLILRGLNSIYLQCQHVHDPKDIKDFIEYIKIWGDSVHVHHHGEEEIFFPEVNKIAAAAGATEDIMANNRAQHAEFDQGFDLLRTHVQELKDGKETYDGKKIAAIIESFAPVLDQHLHDEVKSLLGLEKYDGPALYAAMKKTGDHALKTADPYTVLPFLFGCVDSTAPASKNFPPVPFFMPYMNAYWFTRKHKGVWRFNPSDHFGKPRPLKFLGAAQA